MGLRTVELQNPDGNESEYEKFDERLTLLRPWLRRFRGGFGVVGCSSMFMAELLTKNEVKFTSWRRKKGMWVLDLSDYFGGLSFPFGKQKNSR